MTSITTEEDIDGDDIEDFDATTRSSSSSPDPFLNYEANECRENGSDYEGEPAFKVARRQ